VIFKQDGPEKELAKVIEVVRTGEVPDGIN
jgi:hypothetical protein